MRKHSERPRGIQKQLRKLTTTVIWIGKPNSAFTSFRAIMASRTLLKSVVLGTAIAGIPLLPWYLLGTGVQPTVEWLTFPGYVVSYVFEGPHGMRSSIITIADCIIYSACSYFFVRRWDNREK